jgi:hypothetical protein
VADQWFWPTYREVARELYPTVSEMQAEARKATPRNEKPAERFPPGTQPDRLHYEGA